MIDRRILLHWGAAALVGGVAVETVRFLVNRQPAPERSERVASAAPQRPFPPPADRVYRLAMISPSGRLEEMREGGGANSDRLFRELRLRGYVEGQNLQVKRLNAIGLAEKDWSNIAREAVAWGPDVIHVRATRMALLVKEQT